MYLPKTVEMVLGEDPVVTYRAKEVSPEKALRALVAAGKLSLTSNDDQYWIRSTGEPSVTLDVKDAEAREILKSMQRQCGIKNLMIDPQVQGTGTFLFNQVPCRQAFTIVLRSMGLAAQTYSNNIVSVGAAQH
jgi:type II secretory pathway component GspD/PulD (secretin)